MRSVFWKHSLLVLMCLGFCGIRASAQSAAATEGNFIVKDFRFRSGERLTELRIHYMTMGTPVRDAQGRVTNAVLILHGTGGSGRPFLLPQFEKELTLTGQLLDRTKYFLIF